MRGRGIVRLLACSSVAASACFPSPDASALTRRHDPLSSSFTTPASFAIRKPLSSTWREGACSIEGQRLTYSKGKASAAVTLDYPVLQEPERILCSEGFTLVLSASRAIVALGGKDILEGKSYLSLAPGHPILRNSYGVPIEEPRGEGILFTWISEGHEFNIATAQGNLWSFDMRDPREWK